MARRSVYRLRLLGPVIGGILLAAIAGSASFASAAGSGVPLYQKKSTWADTMLAARAKYQEFRRSQAVGSAKARGEPFVSELIRGDGPGRQVSVHVAGARWMWLVATLEEGGGNCHIWGDPKLIAKDGSVTPLGKLTPLVVRLGWGQLLLDKNWKDDPLKIGGRKFEHGVWVHADSRLCYALDDKYERFEAWVGMDAARAIGAARFKILFDDPDALRELWQNIAADFPTQAKWFAADSGNGEPSAWFLTDDRAGYESTALTQAMVSCGSASPLLQKQVDALRADKAFAGDRRWLELYLRACRRRECQATLDRVWIADIRRVLETRVDGLVDPSVGPDDPRWDAAKARLTRAADAFSAERPLDWSSLRAAIEVLATSLPDRFSGGPALLAQLESLRRRGQALAAGVEAAESKPEAESAWLAEMTKLVEQTRALRASTLSGLEGMREFLAAPAHAELPQEWASQFASLRADVNNRAHFDRVAGQTFCRDALILPDDRDPLDVVLRRTAALLADLKPTPAAGGLVEAERGLSRLAAVNRRIDPAQVEARFVLFADACRLRRRIAWTNPLLDFDKILFIKRHRSIYDHMCDQYYGMAATPGGGVYVLCGAFGPGPQVRDVLADAVVANGRLKGRKLSGGSSVAPPVSFDGMGNRQGQDHGGGSFLSPDLSFDGRSILFAFVECQGDMRHRHHTDPTQGHWFEGRCYHVFKVNVDGTGLEQLTDGTWNDFDPCWLPNGRIAFISERRGGYLRCGRVCPTYTLYDMAAAGGDITCLSFHETNEWHPSVTHDGRILYTRWDYVDRHGCTAHLPWITTLDGRDSRAVHGNFAPRSVRPDMELDCRVIPDSPKLVATAAPHHGQAYGSLVLIDPRVPDDDAMAPVKRLTPEVAFPETQGGAQVYGTPWPLSEKYHLCVYDAQLKPGAGFQGSVYQPGNYGIYLVDAFGNKELIYRDPQIACLGPMPLRPRPTPLATPELVRRGPDTDPVNRPRLPDRHPEGTVAVMNVYQSLKPWPDGTKIKEIRVLQVLPMSVPSGGPPHETALRVASAGDSIVPIRYVLGTAPVEADGSAHFTVPANKELMFQAIDENGLAVQSMRSATYLHEGERLACMGCHEPKHRSPEPLKSMTAALALRRAPSPLKPDADGSNPFSYPRLVQPVLDKHCVGCHVQNAAKGAMNLGREPLVGRWYASYANLMPRWGFSDYGDTLRTTPGKFGARASELYRLLRKGHYDVKLSPDQMHRITLWLDCTSMFYGVYEKEGGEAQLRGEIAQPTLQ